MLFGLLTLALMLVLAGTALAQDGAATTATAEATSGMLTGVRHLHSLVRWIVVIITVVALIKLIMGLVQNSAYDALTARIMRFFSIGIDIQWLIGVILIIVYGTTVGFGVRHIWEHAGVMTVAVVLGHLPARWKNANDRTRYRNSLLIVIVVLALVFVGVALLPQGWRVLPA
jgi:uncharacterized membrane protein